MHDITHLTHLSITSALTIFTININFSVILGAINPRDESIEMKANQIQENNYPYSRYNHHNSHNQISKIKVSETILVLFYFTLLHTHTQK